MKKFHLSLVTENQRFLEKGNQFAKTVCKTLKGKTEYKISNYKKFKNSYRIEISGWLGNDINPIMQSIELTDRISSPWIVIYERSENNVELIFHKSDFSQFRRNEFNVLKWAQFRIDNDS